MKKRNLFIFLFAVVFTLITITAALADDGFKVSKSISKGSDLVYEISVGGYVDEAEHAFIKMMKFYVPMQNASGETGDDLVPDASSNENKVDPRDYLNVDEELVEAREFAKPLIGVYIYGPSEGVEDVGFVGHGLRDAFGAVSLDDGVTWKNSNLSQSANLTSCDGSSGGEGNCNVYRDDIELFEETDYAYPGDVVNIFHAVAGNKVLVAWPSRFCSQGQPNYSLDTDTPTPEQEARRAAIADYLDIDLETASPEALYLVDMYGVGGSQGSVDYEEEDDYEPNQAVGEVPYSCLWTARGVLNKGDDPRTGEVVEQSFMRWFKAERLTSGVRDVNRIETQCVAGAGCAITWQEDPDGLRGGQGEGPGEGWSGAVANSQTDVWYSYIDWEHFDVVQDPNSEYGEVAMTLADYEATAAAEDVTQKPKPFVPFAMPMRLTDNARCNIDPDNVNPKPYCIGSAVEDRFPDFPIPMEYGLKDICADTVTVTTGNPQGGGTKESEICVTADGLPLVGNTAATRPRLNLFGYDSTGEVNDAVIDSAFAVVVMEEDKGLGAFTFDAEGAACVQETNNDPDCFNFDEGKNIKYFSFSMAIGDTVSGHPEDGLLANLTDPGHQLNQPEVNWETGEFYEPKNTVEMWDFGDYNFDIYNTEIARRGSLLAQDIAKVHKATSKTKAKDGLLVLPSWKQGAMNQGGPADVMVRRIIMEKGKWDLSKGDGNPYAFRNMTCETWAYAGEDDSNPYYPGGLCLDSAINMSGTIPDTCVDSETGEPLLACPQVNLSAGTTFGIGDTNPILQGGNVDPNKTKVLTWHQCPAEFDRGDTSTADTPLYTCDNDERTDDSTLADQSWYNPLEVAKGHRGFLDGDFVMMLYAWSPNWRLNKEGNDRYELYIRRSFDGGLTWTTLPKGFTTWDGDKFDGEGTVTCETFRSDQTQASGELIEPRVCNEYDTGAAEQARNVTQHQAMRITTLDPRYAATSGTITSDLLGFGLPDYTTPDGDEEDVRDPSRFFIVYETGNNTTSAEGEPEPLDLFYSRAVNFGDQYEVWFESEYDEVDDADYGCYPSNPHDDTDPETGVPAELIGSGFCNEFDQLEQGTPGLEASEASLTANPGGQFLYAAWAQKGINPNSGEEESDAMVRRVWWIDDYVSEEFGWDFGQGPSSDRVSVERQPK